MILVVIRHLKVRICYSKQYGYLRDVMTKFLNFLNIIFLSVSAAIDNTKFYSIT